MKRLVATVGLAAFGAAGLQAQTIPTLTANPTKPWSVSGTLRGFYDDNLNTAPEGTHKQGVFGFEVSPNLAFQWGNDQTKVSAAYVYSFKYYDHTPTGQSQRYDQDHAFNIALEHAFSHRTQLVAGDSFVVGQEPDYLRAGNSLATFQRIPGNNIRNYGSISLKEQFTRLFGIEVGYNNAYYDYAAHGVGGDPNTAIIPSESGILDRIEHTLHLDTLWTLQPETVLVFGYQFRWADYTGNEEIGFQTVNGEPVGVMSSDRNYEEHYAYLGVNHVFRPDLSASARVGARFIDFYNDPNGNGNGWGPYAQLTLDWTYAQDSGIEIGLSEDINTTDITGQTASVDAASSFTSSQETTVIWGSLHHRFTPRLRGSVMAQFQNGTFKGGGGEFNNKSEQDYLVGLNLNYQFSPHWSTELGYNYDKLSSELPNRSFDRNRVYIGVTAGY